MKSLYNNNLTAQKETIKAEIHYFGESKGERELPRDGSFNFLRKGTLSGAADVTRSPIPMITREKDAFVELERSTSVTKPLIPTIAHRNDAFDVSSVTKAPIPTIADGKDVFDMSTLPDIKTLRSRNLVLGSLVLLKFPSYRFFFLSHRYRF